jgi:hypothetical protein
MSKQKGWDKKDRKKQNPRQEKKTVTTAESKSSNPQKSKEERLKTIRCHACQKLGHMMRNCPDIEDANQSEDNSKTNACRMIALASKVPNKYLLALDNCAYTSVICNLDYMSEITHGKCPTLLNWNGGSHANEISGQLHPFGYCEYNPKAPINLLSEYEVKQRFEYEEKRGEYIIVFVGSVKVKFLMNHYEIQKMLHDAKNLPPFFANFHKLLQSAVIVKAIFCKTLKDFVTLKHCIVFCQNHVRNQRGVMTIRQVIMLISSLIQESL